MKCGVLRVQCEVWSVKCEVWSVIAKKTPSEWAPGNSRLIFKVRCLDKDDLLLHR